MKVHANPLQKSSHNSYLFTLEQKPEFAKWYHTLHKNYNILKNVDIYTFELSKFMYLYREQSPPKIFDAYVLRIEQAHHYNTRSKYHQNYYLNSV